MPFMHSRAGMGGFLNKVGLPRLLRLGLAATIPPLWYEILVLHYRGSFQHPAMWVPVVSLPAVMAASGASLGIADEARARRVLRPFAWAMTLAGAAGTAFHLLGVRRQMGGYRNWQVNIITGPPFPAPAEVGLFGLLAVLASAPRRLGETARLVRAMRLITAASYLLFGVEAGYNHWTGRFFNPLMYVPVLFSPAAAALHLAAAARSRLARRWEPIVSAIGVVIGLIGFGFHMLNVHRRGGVLYPAGRRQGHPPGWRARVSWQNLFYGPPIVAPLQMVALGVLGLLAALYGDRT